MHLKQLKLAGFKSFVDPTVVHFPSQLVAVLGPNGCGKSNIIDAVRWVMGESSAKNLRGDSMTDVIFNGSSQRKPVGQASVELVFDNSLGRLTGSFASYGEIAVKRVVTRDSESFYFLNGSRCRRKDITDIFLGTGAGARGYSIIGQGTISRLIEAKPEELRAFLEEAAGVSKYKERRRETLQRINQTQENLNRIADIRDELDKQLQRLERQAKAAERYTVLKEEEQLCRAQIFALKWQDQTTQQMTMQQKLRELALNYEQQQSALSSVQTGRTLLTEQLHDANEQTQHIQNSFYQLATEIARLEEVIQNQNKEKKRLEQDRQQAQQDWQHSEEQLKLDKDSFVLAESNALQLKLRIDVLRAEFSSLDELWQQCQNTHAQADVRWQELQLVHNKTQSELKITQLKVQHLEQRREQIMLRLEQLNLDQNNRSLEELITAKEQLEQQNAQLEHEMLFDETALKKELDLVNLWRGHVTETEQQLHQLQDDFYRINSEHAALTAAQKAARNGLSATTNEVSAWATQPRLMDVLQVDSKWQAVCEMVLADALHAYVLEDFNLFWPQFVACEQLGASVLTLKELHTGNSTQSSLADKVKGPLPAHLHALEHIYTVDHLDEARALLPRLQAHESVVTVQGFWLGVGWAKLAAAAECDELGLLARQEKILSLTDEVGALQQQLESLRANRDAHHQQLQQSQAVTEQLQIKSNHSQDALRANQALLLQKTQAISHAQQIIAGLIDEIAEQQQMLEDTVCEHLELGEQLMLLQSQAEEYQVQQQDMLLQKQESLATLAEQKKLIDQRRTEVHQAELEYDRELTKKQQINARIEREQDRLDVLLQRLEHLALLCMQSTTPEHNIDEQLAELLMQHQEIEFQLTLSREHAADLKMKQDDLERQAQANDAEVKKVLEAISDARMQEQALAVRASTVQESLDELGLSAEELLDTIPLGVTQSMREDELLALADKIKRLGAINLAAIEEFASEQQRKIYLDEQYDDLSQALTSLATAIDKMDKETRQRLERTFNEVNDSFKTLFPRLFGGGRAQLELTCDNLLEAGIVVMAQPPGKRNSTIHLLSGGEKAMTAVALVFAIFQLNPSPFCMLDEVDAPLDDINVGRFCALVKEMSQFVQFLFITHNKVTMELADHLIGVTMREPGVSRLVAVDVKHALAME